MDYIDHINLIFQHFLKDAEYHKLYKEIREDCKAKFDNYIETGSSVKYANQKIMEENKFLKAKLGLKLQHNPSKLTHKDHQYSIRRLGLSKFATILFYLSFILSLLLILDIYLLIIAVFFSVPFLFLLNLSIIKDNIYNVILYPASIAVFFSTLFLVGMMMNYIDFNYLILLLILVFDAIVGTILYLKIRCYKQSYVSPFKMWTRLSLYDASIVLVYFGMGVLIVQ